MSGGELDTQAYMDQVSQGTYALIGKYQLNINFSNKGDGHEQFARCEDG